MMLSMKTAQAQPARKERGRGKESKKGIESKKKEKKRKGGNCPQLDRSDKKPKFPHVRPSRAGMS